MPPKRKVGRPSRAVLDRSGHATEDGSSANEPRANLEREAQSVNNDPWTDEQEAALFKAMVHWKPVGPFT